MKKKCAALIVALAMVTVSLAGCGGNTSSSTAAPAEESVATTEESTEEEPATEIQTEATSTEVESAHVDVVNIYSDRDPTDLGPFAGNMGGASAQIPLVYQTLQIQELNADPEPCLAKTITQVDDYTYDVELFDYIYDSEGNHFTANDVKWCVEKSKELGKASQVKVIDSVDVTGDYTCTIHFGENAAVGDAENFFVQAYFVTQAAYEAEGNGMSQQPIGTAAYVMSEYISGSVITFTARDDYWQTDEQYIARSSTANADVINFQIITEALQRAIAVENGTLDYASVSLSSKERLESEGYGIIAVPDNLTYMTFLNMDSASVFADNKELREAVFYAMDNKGIAELYTVADAVPVYDISNSNYPDYYGDVYENQDNYYQYDVEKAKELLASSGFDTSQTLELICSADEGSQQIAEIIKTYLEVIGVKVNISSYQGNMMSDTAANPENWDIYLLQYASTDYAVNVWEKVLNEAKYSWGGTINFVIDDELQAKLKEVRTVDTHTEENVVAFHDYLVEQAWCMGIVQGIQYYACSDLLDADNVVMSEQRLIRPNATIYK